MPIYEYQCQQCGTRTELIQKFSDPPLAACPKCGGEVKKLISSPAFQFKGSGWYATDYAAKGKGSAPADEAKSSAKGDDKTEKAEKSEKSETAEKSDKKTEKVEKKETPAATSGD